MVQKKSAAGANSGSLSRMCMSGTLASGKTIVLGELTGSDEIAAAQEAENNPALLVMCQVLRSLIKVEGKDWDSSNATSLTMRNIFSSKDWRMLMEMHAELNMPTVTETEIFRSGWKKFVESPEDSVA